MGYGGDGGGEVGLVEAGDCGGGGGKGIEFPLRTPVRVLLVEGDNSTCKIISALLRKCGYIVFAASDGLEAWKVLKKKAGSIDLILTEAELPSISGFVLLNMIMEHESCKQIPVIMMSSHDSVSMVFKCLLKGAADFLVKPVRKNELRNLWQHVWRRQYTKGSQGFIHGHQSEHPAEQKQDTVEKKASNGSSDNVTSMKQIELNSKKDSDAQSSCTRSEMEVESTYMNPMQEITQDKGEGICRSDKNSETCKASAGKAEIVVQDDDTEDNSTMFDSLLSPGSKVCDATPVTREESKAEIVAAGTDCQTANHRTPAQAIDLIGSIDNQHHFDNEIRNVTREHGFTYPAQSTIHYANSESILGSNLQLELSLRRYLHPSPYQMGKDNNGVLDHSNLSAFSLYNSKTAFASPTALKILSTEDKNSLTSDVRDTDSCNIKSSHENDSGSHANQEHGMLGNSQTLPQHGAAIPPPPSVIPVPVPVTWHASSQIMQPIFYPSQAVWPTVPSVLQETVQESSSNHYDPGGFSDEPVPKQLEKSHDVLQNVTKNMEIGKQQGYSSSNGSSNQLECGGIYFDKSKEASICKSSVENISHENVPAEELRHNVDQREAALAKFRLKRKDRCYDKKVRYESRKRLAEQRPRVKGQFIRQIQQQDSTND